MARFILNIGDSLKSHDEVAGENLDIGDLVYLASNSKWYKASALYKGTSTTELKLVAKKTDANKPTDLIYYGYFTFNDRVLEPNKKYYVSTEDGEITEEVYTNSDNLVRYIGTAYDNTTLLFNPDPTYINGHGTEINEVSIRANTGGSSIFQDDIVVSLSNNKTLGKYENGETIPSAGKSPEEVMRMIAIETIDPTFVNPSLTLSSSVTGVREVGVNLAITLTAIFNRGQIKGKIVNGVWDANAEQNKRAGVATKYLFDGTSNGNNNVKTISNYTTKLGANTFSAVVEYESGPQPIDSAGNNYNSPLPSGNISRTTSYTGVYRRFFGSSSNNNIDNSTDVRALPQTALDNASTTFFLDTGNVNRSFYIVIPDSRTLEKVVNRNTNATVTSGFIESTIQVEDAGGTLRDYRMYKMTNAEPFTANQQFEVEIK